MPTLYNCKHSGDQYRISKFDSDFNLEASYLCNLHSCECPAGHRPKCRHREMLPKFIQRDHIGDGWFFDHDRGGWVQGWKEEPATAQPLPIQPETEPSTSNQELWLSQNEASIRAEIADSLAPAGLGQSSDLEANLSASNEELIAQAQPLDLHQPSPSPTIRRRV